MPPGVEKATNSIESSDDSAIGGAIGGAIKSPALVISIKRVMDPY